MQPTHLIFSQGVAHRLRVALHSLVLMTLLAGLLPPPALRTLLPTPAADLVEAALPIPSTAQAAPLTQAVSNSSVLTITKSVIGTGSGPFNLSVTGPNGYSNNPTVSPGTPLVLTGLTEGVYTVTETSPGAGWTTTYTATPGTVTGSSAVVTLQNVITTTAFLPSSNIALGRAATQSPDYSANHTADKAVDGNTNGVLGNNFMAVANIAANAWWQVDLGAVYNLTNIVLWSRTDASLDQTSNLRVFVSDNPFTSTNYNTTLAQSGVSNYQLGSAVAGSNPLTINRSGRYVRVQLEGTNYLALAEVQIFTQAISGRVFRDFNSNGQIDTTEIGLAGVTATVYDQSGAVVGSAVSDATGNYVIPISAAGPYRVEFSNLPADYEPSTHGSDNGTGTQFVTSSGASTVNFGVNRPCDYCQTNPYLITPQMYNGDPSNASNTGLEALSRQRYETPTSDNTIATQGQIGSTWGLAYNRTDDTLYASAMTRRHAGLGTQGPGAIYQQSNPQAVTPGAPSLFVNLAAQGVDVGTVPSNSARGLGASGSPNVDATLFDAVGKLGLGGLDFFEDDQTLWTVNLNERTLVKIPVANPIASNIISYTIPSPGCGTVSDPAGSAIRINVGGNGFADSGSPARSWLTDTESFRGTMFTTASAITNLNSPGDGTGTTSQTLYQSLRYGAAFSYTLTLPDGAYTVRLHFAEIAGITSRVFTVRANGTTQLSGFNPYVAAGNQLNRAVTQSFTTNVSNGKLVLDFVDEAGNWPEVIVNGIEVITQSGTMAAGQFRPWATKVQDGYVYVGGVCDAQTSQRRDDLSATVYRFDPTALTFTSVLTFPLNYRKGNASPFIGACASADARGRATYFNPWTATGGGYLECGIHDIYPQPVLSDLEFDVDGSLILGFFDRWGHQIGSSGPSLDGTAGLWSGVIGGEILRAYNNNGVYVLENNGVAGPVSNTNAANVNEGPGGREFYYGDSWVGTHAEQGQGGLVLLPGQQEVVQTAMDADNIIFTQGLQWLSNLNGERTDGYSVGSTFAKANGLGDLEILCDPAPLEIGNRVWHDLNHNGVQDPGEPGMNGIVVSRQGPTNTVTTVTSGDGNYYFAVNPNTAYTLTLTPPGGYSLTQADAQALAGASVTSNHPISDTRDSDASMAGSVARIVYTTGSAGQNNHGLDFGLERPASGRVGITNTEPGAIQVTKQALAVDGSNPTVTGNFTINVNCGTVAVTPTSQTVAAGGSVTFSNIPAGSKCTISENTANLPTAPSGYLWLLHQVTPSQVTIGAGQTHAVTVRNSLAAVVAGSNVLTVTKTISGAGSGPFNLTVNGPSGYFSTTQINGGQSKVFTNLAGGVYTVTESAPGWTTTYTATPGTGGSSRAVVNLFTTITAAAVTPAAITGRVYNDYESDGILDTSGNIIDTGVVNVTVTAYDRIGNAVGSATTNSTGNYSLTPTASGPWRLELSNLPSGYEPSRIGAGNGSTTQFVSTSGASNIHFGVLDPCNYCQTSPQLATTEMTFGDPLLAPPSTQAALIRFNYDSPGAITTDANLTQLGAAWGLAYGRTTRLLYVGAFQRRFTGYGPLGTGGIYYFNRNTNTLVNWLNVNTLAGINTGADPHTTLPAVGGGTPVRDPASYDAVGKIGLGDIDISADESTLWAVNLNQRTLLEIPLNGTPPAVPTSIVAHDLSNGVSCTNGVFRPWATKFYNDKIYVGGVCSGENGGTQSNLTAHVLVHDPLGAVGSFSQVFSLPLNYAKGCSLNFGGLIDCNGWNVWQTNWPSAFDAGGGGYTAKTQPILSDLEFDLDGSLILGFADRWGYQAGNANYQPNPPDTTLYSGTTGGDILRVCLVGGAYVAEGGVGCPKPNNDNIPSAPQKTEFYQDAGGGGLHPEAALGALALLPGRGEVVSTKLDPQSVFAIGVSWLNNTTGLSRQEFNTMGNPYNKASAIGDVEVLCDPAPLEIGNRVWNDINGNGLQDPGEPGLNGITVSRQSVTNTVTTVTSGDGNYYFAVSRNTEYTITLTPPSGYNVTQLNAGALAGAAVNSNHAISDTRDSDAVLAGGLARIYYTTGDVGQNNHGLDFGFTQRVTGRVGILNVPPPYSYTLRKELSIPDPVRIGDDITFTIRITNTGFTPLTSLPLRDLYNLRAMTFDQASAAPDDPTDDGQLDWTDLTGAGSLAPNQSLVLTTVFIARNDTGVLPDGATVNTVQVLLALSNTATATVRIEAPTAVNLADRRASYNLTQGVTLAWTTANEAEIAGFHLLRRELGGNEGWVRLNGELIVAQQPGQATGASYTFVDPAAQFGKRYLYLVEIVAADGTTSRHELGLVVAGSRVLLPLVAR